jgi:hypothetical protein
MDDFPLNAGAAAVDDAYLAKALQEGLIEILFDHDVDFARLKAVQVDGILDRHVVHDD